MKEYSDLTCLDEAIEVIHDRDETIRSLRHKLAHAADLAVLAGLAHNTPHSRRAWAMDHDS
jgi:hypothetical protein